MQEEHKSLGGALVDVFDAGVTLVKTEIRALLRQVTNVIKAKGIGVVLLLGAVGPLLMGLVFLILAVFYGLMRLGLGAWLAALLIALLGFILTGVLIMLGLRRLSAEVPNDQDERRRMDHDQMTEDQRLEAQYQAEQAAKARAGSAGATTPTGTADPGTTTIIAVAGDGAAPADLRGSAAGGSTSGFTAGGRGVNVADQGEGQKTPFTAQAGVSRGTETVGSDAGAVRLPVYESQPDGSPQVYGSGLNEKIDGSDTHDAGEQGHGGHDGRHDPNLQQPVRLKDEPGISVSTDPTFREDMKKEGY